MRTMRFRLIVLLLACSLGGCAFLYSYRNIERAIRWSLDDYVTWTPAQDRQLRERLVAQLQWHRDTQLPRYREWLVAQRDELRGDVELAQLQRDAEQLRQFWQDSMARVAPDIAAQLADLSAAQVRDLLATMREQQTEVETEYRDMTTAELVKKRSRSLKKTVQYWLGTLDAKQLAAIDAWSAQLPDSREQWLASRRRWTDAFERALAQRQQPEPFAAAIEQLFVQPQENWDPGYREVAQRNEQSVLALLVDLHNGGGVRQRDAERKRIDQWLDHLDQLAAH